MRLITLLVLLICVKESYSQATITIFNRSTVDIDSVVIDGAKLINYGQIKQASKNSFFVSVDQANFHSFAPFYVKVYAMGHVFSKQWIKTGFIDTFYFFNHGINIVDKPITKPSIFRLTVFNATRRNFDTVLSPSNAILEVGEVTPRKKLVIFDYSKADSNRDILLKLGDTVLKANLSFHDFDNWTDTLSSLYIENDSIFSGLRVDKSPLEYIVDLYLEGVAPEIVHVKSDCIIKTYYSPGDDYFPVKRIVFNYEKLKSNPQFKIKIGKKTNVITLNENDLFFDYKFYFVSKDKVR